MRQNPFNQQRGVVLLVTLIMLVSMTLAAVSMMRSVDTNNMISGNLAFHQAATHSADQAVEAALAWVVQTANTNPTALYNTSQQDGYIATFGSTDSNPSVDPNSDTHTWSAWWERHCEENNECKTVGTDAIGNTSKYIIQRLCPNTGAPLNLNPNNCASTSASSSQASTDSNNSPSGKEADPNVSNYLPQYYYRITARVTGPHNTASYVQAMIAK